jgi:hypothetical protein
VDLGIDVTQQTSLLQAEIISLAPNRGPLRVLLAKYERIFFIHGRWHQIELLSGDTSDLQLLVKAAEGWRAGASLREVERAAPILHITKLAEAHERGPAEAVEARWDLERDILEGCPDGFEELFNAAYAEPRLRQLYPLTSHWSFHFSRSTANPSLRDVPFIDPMGERRFQVRAPDGTVVGETGNAEEAVAIAVQHLSEDCGPATVGRTS